MTRVKLSYALFMPNLSPLSYPIATASVAATVSTAAAAGADDDMPGTGRAGCCCVGCCRLPSGGYVLQEDNARFILLAVFIAVFCLVGATIFMHLEVIANWHTYMLKYEYIYPRSHHWFQARNLNREK